MPKKPNVSNPAGLADIISVTAGATASATSLGINSNRRSIIRGTSSAEVKNPEAAVRKIRKGNRERNPVKAIYPATIIPSSSIMRRKAEKKILAVDLIGFINMRLFLAQFYA